MIATSTQADTARSTDPSWFKDAIIYQLHVKSFFDANNDGVGDFAGLTQRLDHLQDLGVDVIWLLPFYPSPLRDDGYDIADYSAINPSYGSMRDFRGFVREAHARGMKVVTELVINHTSDQHPWFQRARRAPKGSRARNWYVWSDTDQKYLETRIIFKDTETSNWTWDPVAGQYFWHRFFSHQPDLNFDNPLVMKSIIKIMYQWLEMGVDGLRLDAIPYLVERDGTNNENLPETHKVIKDLRAALDARFPDRFLLAEANQWPEDTQHYFGDGDECHMAFHFPLMPRMYMAVAREDRHPITDIMRQTPDIPANCQWAIFLRNHDELTLEMVTDKERDYLWSTYAADPRARINLGIRRRLAPLMDNDRRKIELMNSLLMSMPGTPVMYYGDEIGMGDNVYLGDRNGVRTPMQWSPDRSGGFSRADPASLLLPPIQDPVYGFQAINVEAQARNSASLLNWMKRLIAARRARAKVFGRGTQRFLYPKERPILAYVREYEGTSVLCIANLSRAAQATSLDLSAWRGRVPVEVLGRSRFPIVGDTPYTLTLPPYGFYWFDLADPGELPDDIEPLAQTMLPEYVTLVVSGGAPVLDQRNRGFLEHDILPDWMAARRWFADKASARARPRITDRVVLESGVAGLVFVDHLTADGTTQHYQLPFAADWTALSDLPTPRLTGVVAKLRRGPREGVLVDAAGTPGFAPMLLGLMRSGREVLTETGARIVARGTPELADLDLTGVEATPVGGEQSNSSMLIPERAVVKLYRKVEPSLHPEIEMGRFLTEAGYANTPTFFGSIERLDESGTPTALAVAHRYVLNQGDAWSHAIGWLRRFVDEHALLPVEEIAARPDIAGEYLVLAAQMGRRLAELHQALASRPDVPAFAPEPITSQDFDAWEATRRTRIDATLTRLERSLGSLDNQTREIAEQLLARRADIAAKLSLPRGEDYGVKIRVHGDLHLGQLLITRADVQIVDFEGEPAKNLADRRYKTMPAADVAGMLRSFDYAAWTVLREVLPDQAQRRNIVEGLAFGWRERAQMAFRTTYEETLAGDRKFASGDASSALLDAATIDRAFYEIDYELANRPAWAVIPLAGALTLLFPPEEQ
ncbi:trehalose synthase [Rhodospirillales bacterium TMPK1]|uniref:Maltokinase n=2 Tax=Roseiterribacter gracilis TaxID=2812848 RepID=A0A8S8XEJ9_9PROT|nr:trehalose synthase [Rhodospirillales bacterium TMPK1]